MFNYIAKMSSPPTDGMRAKGAARASVPRDDDLDIDVRHGKAPVAGADRAPVAHRSAIVLGTDGIDVGVYCHARLLTARGVESRAEKSSKTRFGQPSGGSIAIDL